MLETDCGAVRDSWSGAVQRNNYGNVKSTVKEYMKEKHTTLGCSKRRAKLRYQRTPEKNRGDGCIGLINFFMFCQTTATMSKEVGVFRTACRSCSGTDKQVAF